MLHGHAPQVYSVDVGISETLHSNPLAALATLFAAGVATSLTPCIYPMIPITAGLLAGGAAERRSRWRTVAMTASYVTGLAMVYASLGLAAGLSGSLFGGVASNPWVRLGAGLLFITFGLALLDIIPTPVPQRIMRWASALNARGPGGALLLGATSGIVAAPCGAPAFAAVLTWVATTRSGAMGFLYLFTFSLGMTVILVLVGLFSGAVTALPRAGRWMDWIRRTGGVILIGAGLYYLHLMREVL